MTILVILITFGMCMLLSKIIYVTGSLIGSIFKGIGLIIIFPFKLIGRAICKLFRI